MPPLIQFISPYADRTRARGSSQHQPLLGWLQLGLPTVGSATYLP